MTLRQSKATLPRAQTPAQQAAVMRNFRIFQLRGLWYQCWQLAPGRRERAQAAVDEELIAFGAEPETKRRDEHLKRLEAGDFSAPKRIRRPR